MNTIMFLLRQGHASDTSAIAALLASNLMEADLPPEEFLVAEVDGRLVGLARLEREDAAAYIRPIVVEAGWQGKGIGRRLIREISKGLPSVNVIARGSASGFYGCLGFLPVAWEQAPERYRQECAACPDCLTCQPTLMILDRTGGDDTKQKSFRGGRLTT